MKRQEEEDNRKKEEEIANLNKKNSKKVDKKEVKKVEEKKEKPPAALYGEVANVIYLEPIQEPENIAVEKSEKNINLKIFAVSDYASYEVETKSITFKPTLMYTSRTYNF